jgi:hypothetical protein
MSSADPLNVVCTRDTKLFHTAGVLKTCCPIAITVEPVVAKIAAGHSIPKLLSRLLLSAAPLLLASDKGTTSLDEVLVSMLAILELGSDGLLNASRAADSPA